MEKIVIGMSGGVDSSVSALLLKKQGIEVIGIFMKNWEEDDTEEFCSASKDINDAELVCKSINIPFKKVNFSNEYWNYVFKHFLIEYKNGRTPNPDILCNKEIKFKIFLDYAKMLGSNLIATGHYARKHKLKNGEYQLVKGIDLNKDQTYFLYRLNQKQLKHIIFPIGELTKPQVRKIAKKKQFITYDKKGSTGICFIGKRKFKEFLKRYLPAQPGKIHDENGIIIGQHSGLMYYTIGQRQGLGIGGMKKRSKTPWFVVDKNLNDNILVAVQGHDHPLLFKKTLLAIDVHWIQGKAFNKVNCKAKIRYRQPDQTCYIKINDDKSVYVEFKNSQRAIAPGQSIVFYNGDICLGGGIIA